MLALRALQPQLDLHAARPTRDASAARSPGAIAPTRGPSGAARASAPPPRRPRPARSACSRRRPGASCSARNASMAARSTLGCVSNSAARARAVCAFSRIGSRSLTAALGDGAQLLLLLGGGVELDGRVPDAAVDAVLDLCRAQRAAHEAGPVPMAPGRAVLADGAGGHGARECRAPGRWPRPAATCGDGGRRGHRDWIDRSFWLSSFAILPIGNLGGPGFTPVSGR